MDSTYERLREVRLAAMLRKATEMAARWQYLGNRASERGQRDLAERHYSRSQVWRDRMNRLLGNGNGEE